MVIMITPREIKLAAIFIIFGIGTWFVSDGFDKWFTSNFPNIPKFVVGVVIILGILAIFRFVKMPI